MKQFRVTATWTVPYQEKELEFYETPNEYVAETIDALKDNAWKHLQNAVPSGRNFTITVTVEED